MEAGAAGACPRFQPPRWKICEDGFAEAPVDQADCADEHM